MIGAIKKLMNEWRIFKHVAENYETLDDSINNLDSRVFELESMITRVQVEYKNEEDKELSHAPIQLTIYEYIDELPF